MANFTIYLFTYYLPCSSCTTVIRRFLENNDRNVTLYVGFTSLFGGNREWEDPNRSEETRQRRRDLQNLLNNHNGRLYENVGQRFPKQCDRNSRQSRSVSDINLCGLGDYAAELYLHMDFSTGNARAWFHGLSKDYNGWIGLYDEYGNRVTWQWSNSQSDGKVDFGRKIKDGMYAVYYRSRSDSSESIRTSKWDNTCNMEFTKLDMLPRNYGEVSILLMAYDGYLDVCLYKHNFLHWSPNSYDFVAIQSISQFSTGQYVTYEWVSDFEQRGLFKCKQITGGLKASLADGFRAKYVHYSGGYQYENLYDNASPFWTPEGMPRRKRSSCMKRGSLK